MVDIAAILIRNESKIFGINLIFAVPFSSNPRIEFNAHRIYSYDMVLEMFNNLDLLEFCLIPDSGNMIRYALKENCKNQQYACGCFHFIKGA